MAGPIAAEPGVRRADLEPLFRPRGVAVVGASPDQAKPGGRCLRFLRDFGFQGALHPVNPRYDEIDGLPCYADVESVPDPLDLVVLLLGAADAADQVRRAAARGARAAIVCSSGFGEAGPDGAELEDGLRRAAADTGIAVLGPNSLGLVNLNDALAATFSTSLQLDLRPRPGPVALVSQSGAMGAAIFALAQTEGVAVGTFVSTGNEAALGFADYVEHLADDPGVDVILGYVEGVRDGRRLVEAARYARERGKVVAVLKVGRTDAGARAARSHTGALAGSAEVYDAAFRRAGLLQVDSPRELLDVAVAVLGGRSPRGDGVAIVSMSGGAGAIMSDRATELGLHVAELGERTLRDLRELLPAFTQAGNPVDVGGVYTDPDAIDAIVRCVAADPAVDTVLFFMSLSPLMLGVLDERFGRFAAESDKPLVTCWLAGPPDGIAALRRRGIPAYEDPVRAAAAAAALRAAARPLPEQPAAEPPAPAEPLAGAVGPTLGERAAKALVASYGIPVVEERPVATAAAAVAAARELGGPVAVKADADDLLHKSDSGALRLGVPPDEAGAAFDAVVSAARAAGAGTARGALVQPMARPGLELLAGVKHDAQFGPVVVAGLGGVASEALGDVAVELAPLTREAARAMLGRLRGAALLGSFRGAPAPDVEAVVEVLVALGRLAADAGPRLLELDLNPVVVYPAGEGCLVLDAAAVLQEGSP